MSIIRFLFLTIFIILFQANFIFADEPDFKTFRENFEKSYAQIFSASGKYEFRLVSVDGKNSANGFLFDKFADYRFSKGIIYYDSYDEGFKNIKEKYLYRDGLLKCVSYTDTLCGSINNPKALSLLRIRPFFETYDYLMDLLYTCEYGGAIFNIKTVNYNNKECFLLELPGSGVAPKRPGVDPRLMAQAVKYYSKKTLRKVWVEKDNYKPLKYELYNENAILYFTLNIEYQKVRGYGVKDIYDIPKEIVIEHFKYETGEIQQKEVAKFLGEWEINRNYTDDIFTLEFPTGMKMIDDKSLKDYLMEKN